MKMFHRFILALLFVSAFAQAQDLGAGEALCIRGTTSTGLDIAVARILTPATPASKNKAQVTFVADGAKALVELVPSRPARKEDLKIGATVLMPQGLADGMASDEYRKAKWVVGSINSLEEISRNRAEVNGEKVPWKLLRVPKDLQAASLLALAAVKAMTSRIASAPTAQTPPVETASPGAPVPLSDAQGAEQGQGASRALTMLRGVGTLPWVLGPDSTTLMKQLTKHPDPRAIERLLAAGANVNAQDSYGDTALMLASAFPQGIYPEQHVIVELLLKAGARVNTRNNIGDTALMVATHKDSKVIQALVTAGADLTIHDSLGESVLIHQFSDPHCRTLTRWTSW